MSEAFIGEIRMFGGNYAPVDWALCNGQFIPLQQNQALYAVIGTSFGGDGVSTFALPDLRGRVPIHPGQGAGLSTYVLGQHGGSENTTLSTANLPAHTHALNASAEGGTQASPSGGVPAVESTGTSQNYSSNAPDVTMSAKTVGATGSGTPVSIIQPYVCVSFIICLEGIYPTRS
jgi:microcystin-dependent protein